MRVTCPVCAGDASEFGVARVLHAHEASYFRCIDCGSVHVAAPTWLDQAYSAPIAETDVGLVDRNLRLSALTSRVLKALRLRSGTFLDVGAGTGLFVRLMRDRGFDFRYFDDHPSNLFARDVEVDEVSGAYDLVTAFEVVEHLVDPAAMFNQLGAVTDRILVSTVTVPEPAPQPGDWWYYAPENGQHVTFYTVRGLEALASTFGYRLFSIDDLHFFTRAAKSATCMRFLLRLPRWVFIARGSKHSLTQHDYGALVAGGSLAP